MEWVWFLCWSDLQVESALWNGSGLYVGLIFGFGQVCGVGLAFMLVLFLGLVRSVEWAWSLCWSDLQVGSDLGFGSCLYVDLIFGLGQVSGGGLVIQILVGSLRWMDLWSGSVFFFFFWGGGFKSLGWVG